MQFFSGRLPFSVSLFFLVTYLPYPVAPVLLPVSFFFPSLLPSSSPPIVSFPSPVVSFASTAFLLTPPVSSLAPPVTFCPQIARLFLLSPFCLIHLLLCWLRSFPFVFACTLLLSLFFHCLLLAVYHLFLPFSCRLFLFFVPTFSFWATPPVLSFSSPPLLPFALSRVPCPSILFLLFLLLFLLVPTCRLCLLFLDLFFLLSSPRIFSPLLSSLLVLAFPLLLCWLIHCLFVWSSLVTSCTFGSFYDDPFLFPITDDGSFRWALCSLLLTTVTFLSFHGMFFFFRLFCLALTSLLLGWLSLGSLVSFRPF